MCRRLENIFKPHFPHEAGIKKNNNIKVKLKKEIF